MTIPHRISRYHAAWRVLLNLNETVDKVRRARNISQARAAREIGIARATLRRLDAGDDLRTGSVMQILAWLDRHSDVLP